MTSGSQSENIKTTRAGLNPLEKWQAFYNHVKFFGVLLQFEIFTKRPNGPLPYSYCAVSFFTSILTLYTIGFYMNIGQIMSAIPCFCITGIVISVSVNNVTLNCGQSWTMTYLNN